MSLLHYLRNWLRQIDGLTFIRKSLTIIRLYPLWRRYLKYDGLKDQIPWMPFQAREYVEKRLDSTARVFEYGSGGSTLYWARRVASITSVEHDADWYETVSSAVAQQAFSHVQVKLVLPTVTEDEVEVDLSNPDSFSSGAKEFKDMIFRDYAQSILDFPDNHFDLVVVDGRARASCLKQAIPKVKAGGLLLLDDSERIRYRHAIELLQAWERHTVFGPGPHNAYFWETSIWQKPV